MSQQPVRAFCDCGAPAIRRRWGVAVCNLCDQADRYRAGTYRSKARRGYMLQILDRLKQQLMINR